MKTLCEAEVVTYSASELSPAVAQTAIILPSDD